MPKALCISGILVAALVLIVFLTDLLAALTGFKSLAPFQGANQLMDIAFVLCAGGLAFISWTTLKEQV